MRSRLLAFAASAALFASSAFAAPVYVPGQGGAVGPNVACTTSDGASVRCVQPSVTLNDATGAAAGTSGNPIYTTPASGGVTSTVKIDQTTPGTTNGVVVNSIADGVNVTQGAKADAACVANGTCSTVALLKALHTDMVAATPAGTNTIGNVYEASPFPTGATQISAQNNVANGIAQACVGAAVGVHTYVTGFAFTGLGATALLNVQATAAGMKYDFQFPAGVTAIATPIIVNLTRPYDAGVNTGACATLPAAGAGNTSATASIIGFRQ